MNAIKKWTRLSLAPALALLLSLSGCGFGRDGTGIFCSDPCPDPDRRRDLLCNCVPIENEEEEEDRLRGLVHFEEEGQCNPVRLSPQVYVKNSSSRTVRVVTKQDYIEGGSRVDGWPRYQTSILGPFERDYLGCDGDLFYDYQYTIQSVSEVRDDAASLRSPFGIPRLSSSPEPSSKGPGGGPLAHILPLTLAVFQAPADASVSCSELCPDLAISATCNYAPLDPDHSLSEPLEVAYHTVHDLSAEGGLLPAAQLREWFGIELDPCRRGDTAFVGSGLVNVGETCLLKAQLDEDLFAIIEVPVILEGSLQTQNGIRVEFVPNRAPTLQFVDIEGDAVGLDADFGGSIRHLEAKGRSLFFRTKERRCVGIGY